ncbi:hypothetical protein D9619_007225 [Psilocybe cf. subviscida]|uniref:thioredoxin-dependent peroxiredoxin n=1 Tax=Psilocybe cf. subviscida TaxID=2480587 RepID=A0A8H5B2U3_9AGAR|nr:hypothetical protein D9619_007225 [Psilocybe cf. subviscida]
MSYQNLIGKTAPSFTLKNYDGKAFTFTPGANGLPTALFFYPESGSKLCTKQACQFRQAIVEKDTFSPSKVHIVGISPDSVEKQKKFVADNKLTFPVLSDSDKSTFKTYQIGRGIMGLLPVSRVTFIVDKKGSCQALILTHSIRDALDATVNYGAHAKFVEKWLDQLETEN